MMRAIGRRDERGVALITVMGLAGILFVITTTIAVQSLNNLKQAGNEKRFEQSIQVADAGIEQGLFELNKNPDAPNLTTVTPVTTTRATERASVVSAATTLATNTPTALKSSPDGQYVMLYSPTAKVLYSVGWSPSFTASAATKKIRVVRASYATGPTPSRYAILTRGDLVLGPSHTSIKGGAVHSNGNLTVTGHGKVDGYVTSTGTFTNSDPSKLKFGDTINSGGGRPAVDVPMIKPIDYYRDSYYDLCPDGTVRPGPKYPSTPKNTVAAGPCNASLSSLPIDSKTGFRGWFFTPAIGTSGPIWQYKGKVPYDGVYYIHNGTAFVSNKVKKWNVTILASASGSDCNLTGGDIVTRNGTSEQWAPNPDGEGILFLAGRDFDNGNVYSNAPKQDFANGRGHMHKTSGIIYAYEQFRNGKDHLELAGSIMTYGLSSCNSPGSPAGPSNVSGHPHITWAGTLMIPTDRVRVTQWEEL